MYSDNGSGPSAFTGTPTQTGGVLSGVSSGNAPSIQVLYQGIDGALNTIGRSGVTTPIDANRYRRLSFRARRSVGTPDAQDRIAAFWFPDTSMAGSGFALWQARGTLAGFQHANMMPQAAQAGATYQIYRVDLDRPLQASGAAWSGLIKGLKVRLALVEHRHELDHRPRLDPPDRAGQPRRDPPPAVERPRRPRRRCAPPTRSRATSSRSIPRAPPGASTSPTTASSTGTTATCRLARGRSPRRAPAPRGR